MSSMNRRDFLMSSVAGAAFLTALAAEVGAEEAATDKKAAKKAAKKTGKKHRAGVMLGAQSYSFRNFKFDESIKKLKELGLNHMEFCSVHFPPKADDPGFAKIKETLTAEGIKVPCFGVESFTADAAANRVKFEFAKALGIEILTADPEPESFDSLEKLCEEFKIKIAIHNHGPKSRYDKVADTLKAIENRHPFIGACVDTGHSIRSGEKPDEVILALGKRVHSLHLKDWKQGGEEQILGEGDMDVMKVAMTLKKIHFSGPIMFEYENSPDNPVPDMKKGLENWNKAWSTKESETDAVKDLLKDAPKEMPKDLHKNPTGESKK